MLTNPDPYLLGYYRMCARVHFDRQHELTDPRTLDDILQYIHELRQTANALEAELANYPEEDYE